MQFRLMVNDMNDLPPVCAKLHPTFEDLKVFLQTLPQYWQGVEQQVGVLTVTTCSPVEIERQKNRTGWDNVYLVEEDGLPIGFVDTMLPLSGHDRFYDDGSYTVNGIVFNQYTNLPSKRITVAEAAELAEVTERTMRKWLKKAPHIRRLIMKKGFELLDYEVQHWLAQEVHKVHPKRTWKRALKALYKLVLIDRDAVLEKLQATRNRKWTDVQLRANRFDLRHVAAYRRGLEDAMRIVRNQGIECWDYVPKIGHIIWVGGSTGMITSITDEHVIVKGTYVGYAGENMPPDVDNWTFKFLIEDVMNADVRPTYTFGEPRQTEKTIHWDYENIPHQSR